MRLPRAADLGRANLQGGGGAAQLNLSVAKETGAAAQALGSAIAQAGGIVGKIAGLIDGATSQAKDAFALPEAQLAFDQQMFEAESGLYSNAGEDGSGLKAYPQVATSVAANVEKEYGARFSPEDKAKFGIYAGRQTLEGTKRAYNLWQNKATAYAEGKENSLVEGRFLHLDQSGGWSDDAAFNSSQKAAIDTVQRSVGQTRTEAQAAKRINEITGQFASQRIEWLSKNDPEAAKVLLEKIESGVVDENAAGVPGAQGTQSGAAPAPGPQSDAGGGPVKVYGQGQSTPSRTQRAQIFKQGGVVVNLDTNWAKGDKPTTPMVVIPDGATPEQQQAAKAYASEISNLYEKQFGVKLTPKVLTRSQNGRGRPFTIHTEPYAVTDSQAVKFFSSQEGAKAHAQILRNTFGKVPGVQFSLPHDPYGNGDHGAEANGVNEVSLARLVLGEINGADQGAPTETLAEPSALGGPKLEQEPKLVRTAEMRPTSDTMTDAGPAPDEAVGAAGGEGGGGDPGPIAGVRLDMSGGQATAKLPTQLVEQLYGVAAENPDAIVSEFLTEDQNAQLAETGLIDPEKTTVGQVMQLAQAAQAEGALSLDRKQAPGPIEGGRLLKGQTFSVKAGGKSFSITAEQWNAISPKQRQALRKSMQERVNVVQKERVYAADHMMKTQLATVERTGKGAEKFDPKLIAKVYRDQPQKIQKFNDQIKVAQFAYDAQKDVWDLPDEQLEARKDEIETRLFDGDGDVDPNIAKVYERTQKKLDQVAKLRATDPAKSVENTKEVRSFVQKFMPEGQPNSNAQLYGLVDARIQAQVRLGMEPTPLTKREAVKMLEPLVRAGSFQQKKELARELVTNLRTVYQEHAEVVLNSALFLNSRETEDDRLTLSAQMRAVQREQTKPEPPKTGRGMPNRQDRLGPSKPNPYDQFYQ